MTEREHVRRYFSDSAHTWLARAYGEDEDPLAYPVGAQRLRLAMNAVLDRLGEARGRLLDLGCGGGDLCLHAARLGFDATGVDAAEGMIAEAEARRSTLPADVRERVSFKVADILGNGLATASADAVTAIGVLEYLEEDAAFFAEAARLLRVGGALVVSCRNRLFNMVSGNEYTLKEVEAGAVPTLLAELSAFRPDESICPLLTTVVAKLREALPDLERALAKDAAGARGPDDTLRALGRHRRQHTPSGLAASAAAAGFSRPRFFGVHPHVLTPALESLVPRFYNRLTAVLEPLESTPASLGWSSAFLGVFTR